MSAPVHIVDEPLTATGTWMTPPQVNNLCEYREGGLWLGRNGDDAKSAIGRKDDSHVLLCAMNRSGKGRGLITNNLLLWRGSLFCNDPKGENASVCAARRGQGSEHTTAFLDQKTCVLDSHHTAKVDDRYRAYYNVLDDLDPANDDTPSLAKDIAESCVTEDVKKDPTWDEMAIPFMQMYLLQIISSPQSDDPAKGYIPAHERDLVTFRQMILKGDFNAIRMYEASVDRETLQKQPPDLHMHLLKRMIHNPSFGGMISDYAENLLKSLQLQPKLWNSIRQAAETATAWIDDLKLRKVLRAGTYQQTFSAREFKENPKGLSLFVCLRLKDQKKYAAWPRILNNMAMAFAQDDYHATPATGHSTLMMLDEFASLGRMAKMENDISAIAGAGVKVFMVFQSLSQARSTYGENWETFVSSAGTQVFFGFNDNFTAEYVSKRLGDIEVIRKMRSGSTGITTGESITDTEGGSSSRQTTRGRSEQYGSSSSHGGGSSYQDSYGTGGTVTNGWSPSLFHISLITSMQRGNSHQKSTARGEQTSWQQAKNRSRGTTYSESETEGESWSRAVSRQRSETITEGWQETLHKRPLAAINDLIKLFGTVEDESKPNFPGIGLIVTSSSELDPFMVIKGYYDRDPYFKGLFDPHPKWGIARKTIKPANITQKQSYFITDILLPDFLISQDKPRITYKPNPTISNPNAVKEQYNDPVAVKIPTCFSKGQKFKKGDIIATFHYLPMRNSSENVPPFYELKAPSGGFFKEVYNYGYEVELDHKIIQIRNEQELSDINYSKKLSDGNRITSTRRTNKVADIFLERELINGCIGTDIRFLIKSYAKHKDAELELKCTEANLKELKSNLKTNGFIFLFLLSMLFWLYVEWGFQSIIWIFLFPLTGAPLFLLLKKLIPEIFESLEDLAFRISERRIELLRDSKNGWRKIWKDTVHELDKI